MYQLKNDFKKLQAKIEKLQTNVSSLFIVKAIFLMMEYNFA